MDFELSMEQDILRKTVRDFAEKEIAPVARELDQKEFFSLDTCRAMGELGLFGMIVSEDYGGQGMDYVSYIIAVEEIARIDGSHAATIAAGNSLGISPLFYYGSEEQKMKYLPKLCTGEGLWGFGLTEPGAGSDAGNSATTAVLDGDEWVINGSKIFITNASAPNSMGVTVMCKTGKREDGRDELSCILVELGTPGFEAREMHGKMMWRASNTSELYFDDCRVPKENLLGTRGKGFHQMLETLDGGRLSIGAMGVGGAQGAYELALRYSKERVQFNKPVASFQVNAFKLADMAMEIEAARLLLYNACWLRDNHKFFSKHAAMAKLYASEVMGRVTDQAVQLHGGYGLMQEYDVERFYRDYKLLTIGEGTSEIQRLVIARLIGAI
ncbi:MAG: acyl-CoA dehydrogenase family protein [Desulfarculaceae bacterium]|nr:acyl-CoA dehydrogenase family protein [Desulfarculaceae bacterium]MCF8072213.1 acyl-CoA dehydrogenase family protein [Desulfarculaceae bacterium]MCF8100134.1 acyl-CoA dehydrogenase family protein [Desulfarculaceae bacterium]MCF8117217.1 acyl-CoA dehydrogenase family protein [Desulfarculaceae bacterium]